MSSKAKLTFAASITFAVITVVGVHYMQIEERFIMREGPRRDDEKAKIKRQNQLDLEYQQKLQRELEKDQNVSATSN
ncbi:hypothetical protein K502DRAFT_368095 [Neoconidiobolus thromboides FSU 785]|nr:hypothetical protein K502DRAFT_368095 [Neoconidiobolus thromboides FSU 785]